MVESVRDAKVTVRGTECAVWYHEDSGWAVYVREGDDALCIYADGIARDPEALELARAAVEEAERIRGPFLLEENRGDSKQAGA